MNGVFVQPASKETSIAMTDLNRMHCEEHCRRVPIPRWSQSDEKIRKVVTYKICLTAGEPNVPTNLNDLRKLEKRYLYQVVVKNHKTPEAYQHVATVRRFGGPITYFTSLLYRRYRLGMSSPELSLEYGVSPAGLRQTLNRLCYIARWLFPDANEHLPWHHSARQRVPNFHLARRSDRPSRKYKSVCFRIDEIRAAYLAGKSVPQIAQEIGFPRRCGNNRVRAVLIDLGIYKRKNHA